MNVSTLCRRKIVTVDAQATLQDAAMLMREQHVGALVVTSAGADGREEAVGIVTDRDLVVDAMAQNLLPSRQRVAAVASGRVAGVPGTAGLAEAVATMEGAGVRRLLVTGADGAVIGVLSADDLLTTLAGELGGLARAMRGGLAREAAARPAPPRQPVFLPFGTPGMTGASLPSPGVVVVETPPAR